MTFDFKKPDELKPEELRELLDNADEITKWLTSVKGYALDKMLSGDLEVPGWKVVEGKSNRKIKDEKGLAAALIAEGFSEANIYKPKALETLTNLEKLVGKKAFASKFEDKYIYKPEGNPTLAPESDKRPALKRETAAEDFKEEAPAEEEDF